MGFVLQDLGLIHANGHRALRGINLRVARGGQRAIIDPSGAGKTSLTRLVSVARRPTDERLQMPDASPWSLAAGELPALRARIGVVQQAPPMLLRLRVVTAILAGRLGQWPWWKSVLSLLYPVDTGGAHAVPSVDVNSDGAGDEMFPVDFPMFTTEDLMPDHPAGNNLHEATGHHR